MVAPDIVKFFVREVLHCTCPDEIFDSAVIESHAEICSGTRIMKKLIIGDRLLVYIAGPSGAGWTSDFINRVLAAGIRKRDLGGLNRFRLVLVTDSIENMKGTAEKVFLNFEGRDDKTHLHVIDREAVRPLETGDSGAS